MIMMESTVTKTHPSINKLLRISFLDIYLRQNKELNIINNLLNIFQMAVKI